MFIIPTGGCTVNHDRPTRGRTRKRDSFWRSSRRRQRQAHRGRPRGADDEELAGLVAGAGGGGRVGRQGGAGGEQRRGGVDLRRAPLGVVVPGALQPGRPGAGGTVAESRGDPGDLLRVGPGPEIRPDAPLAVEDAEVLAVPAVAVALGPAG